MRGQLIALEPGQEPRQRAEVIVFEVMKQDLAVGKVLDDVRRIVVGPNMQRRRRECGAD
jgi:hypothetical protein